MTSLSQSERYSQLLQSMDRAALDPAAWVDVCNGMSNLVQATGTLMIPFAVEKRGLSLPCSPTLGEALESFVKTGMYQKDFRSRGFPKAISAGFVTDQDLIAPEEMRRHSYYAEWLQPLDLQWFAGISFQVEGQVWGAAVQGSPARGPFLAPDVEQLMRVRADLSLAAQRAAALGNSRIESLERTFAAADRGVAVIDWSGRISWLNSRAEQMLRDGDLALDNRLRSTNKALDRQLTDLLASVIAYKFSPGWITLGPIRIPMPADRAIIMDAVPMPRDFQTLLGGATGLLTMHEITPGRVNATEDPRVQFRLTGRESEIVAQLASGTKLADAAASLGMSLTTARQHVKSIFAKTGTHRQAELVALLARLRS